jgi:bacterioferritin-associated ferredoxin
MVVCSCRAVTDRAVRAAIAAGATTVEAVTDRCAAASKCGGCWPELERLLQEHNERHAALRELAVSAVA